MKKPLGTILYLTVVSLLVFYSPKLISSLWNSGDKNPSSRADDAHMDKDAYLSLREVAAVQLEQIVITYTRDETTGRFKPRYNNMACPNPQADQKELEEQFEIQLDQLHARILLLGPVADEDDSGFVSREEGARLLNLYEFGHLAALCFALTKPGQPELVPAMGFDPERTAEKLKEYQDLMATLPAEMKAFFPVVEY